MEKIIKEMEKWPFYIGDAVEALPTATGEERTRLMRFIAANVGDEATLRSILGVDPEEFASFYPDMAPVEMNTTDTIDSFISRFSSEEKANAPEVEELVIAPAIDYAATLELGVRSEELGVGSAARELGVRSEELGDGSALGERGDGREEIGDEAGAESDSEVDSEADSTLSAIDSFLQKVPVKKPAPRSTRPSQPSPTLSNPTHPSLLSAPPSSPHPQLSTPSSQLPTLSEELVKIMVKKGNYRKALEIITELSLNNPKKSIYFADQMRFLQKLIANQERFQTRGSGQETRD